MHLGLMDGLYARNQGSNDSRCKISHIQTMEGVNDQQRSEIAIPESR